MNRLLPLMIVAAGMMLAHGAAAQNGLGEAIGLQRGKQVFDYWCADCHGAGPGRPGTSSLAFKYKAEKPALLEERTDLTSDQVRFFVRNGVSVMPFYRKVEIGDGDLDALATYLARNLK